MVLAGMSWTALHPPSARGDGWERSLANRAPSLRRWILAVVLSPPSRGGGANAGGAPTSGGEGTGGTPEACLSTAEVARRDPSRYDLAHGRAAP